jgi:hypothetical protein
MKKIILTGTALGLISAALIGQATFAGDSPANAIRALYAAPDRVQWAIYRDQCADNEHTQGGRAYMNAQEAATYDGIMARLNHAYRASSGTDSAVESINAAFCEAADNR